MSVSWPFDGKLRDDIWINRTPSRYTPAQILEWLKCISYPLQYSEADLTSGKFPTTLDNLKIINRLHIAALPYENTEMHYSANHDMSITHDALFDRLIGQGKGSYCFGMNIFFLEALRGLGYRAYSGAARINEAGAPTDPPLLTPFVHMVLFVQPGEDNTTYLVDVGCGGSGPSQPILLSCDPDNVVMGISPTEHHRLLRRASNHPETSLKLSTEVEWALEVLHDAKHTDKHAVWRLVYTFTEVEFFATDYGAANFVVSKMPGGLFYDNVVCSRHFWLTQEEAEALGGGGKDMDSPATRYLGRIGVKGGVFRRHIGKKSELLAHVKTEKERRYALQSICNVEVAEEDLVHIEGRVAALTLE